MLALNTEIVYSMLFEKKIYIYILNRKISQNIILHICFWWKHKHKIWWHTFFQLILFFLLFWWKRAKKSFSEKNVRIILSYIYVNIYISICLNIFIQDWMFGVYQHKFNYISVYASSGNIYGIQNIPFSHLERTNNNFTISHTDKRKPIPTSIYSTHI